MANAISIHTIICHIRLIKTYEHQNEIREKLH